MKPRLSRLPILLSCMGGAAFVLRLSLYLAATDHKGLLIAGHPLEFLLWLLTAAAAAVVLISVRKQTDCRSYEENFPCSTTACIGCFLFAAGFGLTASRGFPAFSVLEKLRNITGLLSVPALIAAGICRKLGKRPFFGFHGILCLALTLHTISYYRIWSSSPQLQDALFPMLGCIGLMLFAYYQTAFDTDIGSRRMQLGSGLLAAFCCFAAAPVSSTGLMYLTGGIWTLTNLCALTPTTKNKEEIQ